MLIEHAMKRSIVSDNVPSSAPSTPTPEPSHAELLEQLKTQVPEVLFAMVSGRLNAYAHELAYSKLKIPGSRRESSFAADRKVWTEQREAEQFATGAAGTRARRQSPRSGCREPTSSSAACY